LRILAVGFEPGEDISIDGRMTLRLGEDVFFEPRFIEVSSSRVVNRALMQVNSSFYRILPEAFVTRRDFELHLEYPPGRRQVGHSGLCWLDQDKDKWIWLENVYDSTGPSLTALSTGGGSFAAVYDYEEPRITGLSIRHLATVRDRQPEIRFVIEDSLSGIGDDRDIRIELDGRWLIPEYEPETGQVRSRPLWLLERGEHHLGLIVRDRAGNKTEQYLRFNVQ
jgi:hypothetical protein